MLSLSTAKSGALIGVLISVTTIPAAANIGLAAAYQDWTSWRGSLAQLGINLGSILVAGTARAARCSGALPLAPQAAERTRRALYGRPATTRSRASS